MSARNAFTWTGLDELRAALRNLPAELTADASAIVDDNAERAKSTVFQAYPPGELRDRLVLETVTAGSFGVAMKLSSRSPWAYAYENGTEARHTLTGAGRGRQEPKPTVIPAITRYRARMYAQLADMLRAHGLEVSGHG